MMPVFERFNEIWSSVLRTFSYMEVSTRDKFYIFDEYQIWQLLPYVAAFTTVLISIGLIYVVCSLSTRCESSERNSYSTNQTYYNYTHTNHEQRNQSDRYISIQEHQCILLDEQRSKKILESEIQRHICNKERSEKYLRDYYQRKLLEEQNEHYRMEKDYQQNLQREKIKQTLSEEHWKTKFQEQQQQKQLLEKQLQQTEKFYQQLNQLLLEISKQLELYLLRSQTQRQCILPVGQRPLFQATLKDDLAIKWDPMPPNKAFIKVAIKEDTDEFINVKDSFKSSTQKKLEIVKIERVQNPFLLGSYMLKKLEMENIFGASNVVEMNLFHATKANNVESICENNFNWRLYGENMGNRYGRGVSFTPFWHYAIHYSDKNAVKVMFLVRVLISKSIIGNQNMEIPPLIGSSVASDNLRFDTTYKNDMSVVVKYSDNDFYPQYLIYYSAPKRKRSRKHKIHVTEPKITMNETCH